MNRHIDVVVPPRALLFLCIRDSCALSGVCRSLRTSVGPDYWFNVADRYMRKQLDLTGPLPPNLREHVLQQHGRWSRFVLSRYPTRRSIEARLAADKKRIAFNRHHIRVLDRKRQRLQVQCEQLEKDSIQRKRLLITADQHGLYGRSGKGVRYVYLPQKGTGDWATERAEAERQVQLVGALRDALEKDRRALPRLLGYDLAIVCQVWRAQDESWVDGQVVSFYNWQTDRPFMVKVGKGEPFSVGPMELRPPLKRKTITWSYLRRIGVEFPPGMHPFLSGYYRRKPRTGS